MAQANTEEIQRDGVMHAQQPDRKEAFLPSSVPQTHASFLLPLSNGDLACVWFAGTQEGLPDVSIYLSILPAGGNQWSAEVKISDDETRSEQNPVLFETPSGELWVLWTAQEFGNQDTAIVRKRASPDLGKSWGEIETLFAEEGTFIRQPVVVLENGEWVLPVFYCLTSEGEKWTGNQDISAVQISSDNGKSWTRHDVPDSMGMVHMNVLDMGGGALLALFRSRWADNIHVSRSSDRGRTWSVPEATELPNNNSSIQARQLSSGEIALVYNHISARDSDQRRESLYDEIDDGSLSAASTGSGKRKTLWGIPRAPLTLAISRDGGKSWPVRRNIEEGDGWCLTNETTKEERRNHELSYPTVAESPDGTLNIAFTYFRRAIKFVQVPRSWADAV